MTSVAYDLCQNRRAWREHKEKINRELVIPPLGENEAWEKVKKVRTLAKNERDKFCEGVDKDINVYDRALWDAAKAVAKASFEEEPSFSQITALRDQFFQYAYEAIPSSLRCTQIAPRLDENGNEVEEEFTEDPPQPKLFDNRGNVTEEARALVAEKEKKEKKLAPKEHKTCDTCGAKVDKVTPNPLVEGALFSYKCGALINFARDSKEVETVKKCPDDARPMAEFPPDRDADSLAQVAAEFCGDAEPKRTITDFQLDNVSAVVPKSATADATTAQETTGTIAESSVAPAAEAEAPKTSRRKRPMISR